MNLTKKLVMITGANTGIGKETALLFAAAGAKVIITYKKNKEEAEELAEEVKRICSSHTEPFLLKLNLREENSLRKAFDQVNKTFGSLDLLINNAGILIEKPFAEQTLSEIKKQVEVNLIGLMQMTSAFLPLLQKSEEALIINIASRLSKKVVKNKSTYIATKFGIRGFTQALAIELPQRIRTYCVNPVLTATRMTNFQGIDPKRVAQIILEAAKENLNVASGGDVDVEEFLSQNCN